MRNLKIEIWIDVGAYPIGGGIENTFEIAKNNPNIIVYAFEPNLRHIAPYFAIIPNYVVIPMAIAEDNGFATFHFSNLSGSDSLLPYDESYKDAKNINKSIVPTIRLDTFINYMKLDTIDFLKIDAQGFDFYVVRSLGDMLKIVKTICLEVQIMDPQLYIGAQTKSEIVKFLEKHGFKLIDVQSREYDENLTFNRL